MCGKLKGVNKNGYAAGKLQYQYQVGIDNAFK